MSTVKISELTALSSADAADELVIVDDSAGVTKKITQGNLNVLIENADDYDEGTWTPVATMVTGGLTFTRNPTYIKIGNLVTVTAFIKGFDDADTGDLQITGLPFGVKNNLADPSGAVYALRMKTAAQVSIQVRDFDTFYFRRTGTTDIGNDLLDYLDSDTAFAFSVTYVTE